jgi:Holliday junction resolvase
VGLTRYEKGARSERELLNILDERGYSVTRSAGSGVNSISPDLVAIKKGSCISIECKAWDRGSLALDAEQYEKLIEWESNTEFPTFVAWRMNGMGWFFIKLGEFEKGRNNYNITRKKVVGTNRKLEDVLLQNNPANVH